MHRVQISFQVTEVEKNLLEDVAYLEPWLPDAIDHRKRRGNHYQVRLDGEEVRDCLDALLYESNYGVNRQRKVELLALAEKVRGYARLKI